jgi:hypothetical protein
MQGSEFDWHAEETLKESAELGHTWVKLPFGGMASSSPEEVRRPQFPTFALLAATAAAAVAGFVLARLLLW